MLIIVYINIFHAENAELHMVELTEDIIQLDISKENTPSIQCSNSFTVD